MPVRRNRRKSEPELELFVVSDREFENYLTLIGRLLRLSAAQREAIGAELRDHFESRLTELTSRGLSHDAAVQIALEEFGDAAGLAAQFSRIAQTRKRRLIVRCTLASAAALAAAFLMAISLWPENHAPINHAVGQTAEKPAVDKLEKVTESAPDAFTAITNEKLNRFIEVNFADNPIPLKDFFDYLDNTLDFESCFDQGALQQAGIDPAATLVSKSFKHIRGKMLLDLVLVDSNLGYRVRDGLVIVSTKDKLGTELEVRIYDARNILDHDKSYAYGEKASAHDHAHPERRTAVPDNDPSAAATTGIIHLVQAGGAPQSERKTPSPDSPVERLINVIVTTVNPETWSQDGGQGTISEYGGLLVIAQTEEVHRKVDDLLEQLESRLNAKLNK
jgi:hypothetical protein